MTNWVSGVSGPVRCSVILVMVGVDHGVVWSRDGQWRESAVDRRVGVGSRRLIVGDLNFIAF